MRDVLNKYIIDSYGAEPEFLWSKFPHYAVYRHKDNKKWFAIIMDVEYRKLGVESEAKTDIINLKLGDPLLVDTLINDNGYYKAYHMAKNTWITIALDGSVSFEEIVSLLSDSYYLTASEKEKKVLYSCLD